MCCVTPEDLEAARERPPTTRLGERLIELGRLTEESLYQALSTQAGIPLGAPRPAEITPPAARMLPAEVVRHWHVLPFRISLGQLHVATTEIPSDEMARDLARFSTLDVRFRLLRPAEFLRLAELTGAGFLRVAKPPGSAYASKALRRLSHQ